MAKLKLKSVLSKNNSSAQTFDEFRMQTGEELCIIDDRGRILYGSVSNGFSTTQSVQIAGENIGTIQGGTKIVSLASAVIDLLLVKESEKKIIGQEVLDLYREINLIYNFTEQLANFIDPESIARLALVEGGKLIKSLGGSVILWENRKTSPILLSTQGNTWDLVNKEENIEALKKLFNHHNAAILTGEALEKIDKNPEKNFGSILFAPLKVKNQILGIIFLIGDSERSFTAAELKLLTTIALQAASAIESALMYRKQMKEARIREETMKKVQEMTSRFVPFEFLKSLGHESLMETRLGDHVLNDVTVVFLDIRKFTTLAEGMTPEENFKFVNSFNGRIGPVIKENNGFINQYQGDGIMVIFPHHPVHALKASIEMQKVLQEYNAYRQKCSRQPIRMGIGIHTGSLIMGITGDNLRWEATTISDVVNTAARIESLTKYYKCNIILSHETLKEIENSADFNIRSLGLVQVKGRQNAIRIYECFDGDAPDMIKMKQDSIESFNKGVGTYENRSFRDSTKSFSQVLVANPDDETAQCFLGRISNLLSSELDLGWNGIEKMQNK